MSQGRSATEDGQRFPLNYIAAQRAAQDPSTAQAALAAYQRMGADLEGEERFAQAAVAYSNAATSARALGRLQVPWRQARRPWTWRNAQEIRGISLLP